MMSSEGGIDLPPFFTLSAFETIGSTNIYARELADKGAAEGQLVWSLIQEQGVGRRGRGWTSPRGNLYCSVLLRPDCTASEGAKLSFMVAVALHRALVDHLPEDRKTSLKWPNDLLINRKKLAGILLESKSDASGRLDWLVIGTGVNIASYPKKTEGLPATSLKNEGATLNVQKVLEGYAFHLLDLYTLWKENGFEPVRQAWLAAAGGIGERITVRLPGEEFGGLFTDLDPDGALVLKQDDGSVRLINAGEVFFSGV